MTCVKDGEVERGVDEVEAEDDTGDDADEGPGDEIEEETVVPGFLVKAAHTDSALVCLSSFFRLSLVISAVKVFSPLLISFQITPVFV